MKLMSSISPTHKEVRREALLCCQKIYACLEGGVVAVTSEVFAEFCNIVRAGADVWLSLVDVALEITGVTELSSSVVDGSHQEISLDETVQESASESIDTLDNVD